jgi:hypothetical protein
MAKGKNIFHRCGHCERITKMEIIGASEDQPERTWYRCTRCRHATLVNIEELKRSQEEAKKKLEPAQCQEYNPLNTYSIGQAIFHSEWGDVGKIISKERTSGGDRAIVVSFEKLGERRLLESVIESFENNHQP